MQGLFLALTMHDPLGCVIREILWIIAWRVIMSDPIKWARSADGWNATAHGTVWDDQFRKVHFYMLRAQVAFLLFEVATLVRQTASSYLALGFHHKKFFRTMQVPPTPLLPVRMQHAYAPALLLEAARAAGIFIPTACPFTISPAHAASHPVLNRLLHHAASNHSPSGAASWSLTCSMWRSTRHV